MMNFKVAKEEMLRGITELRRTNIYPHRFLMPFDQTDKSL